MPTTITWPDEIDGVLGNDLWYLPHTDKGYAVPPNGTLVNLVNGGVTKLGVWQARRRGTMGG